MLDEQLRLEALKQAVGLYQRGDPVENVLEMTKQFYAFLAEKRKPVVQADASKAAPPLPKGT